MEADRFDIETPEHVRVSHEIAGFGSRFLAALMDHLILFAAFTFLGVLLAFMSSFAPGIPLGPQELLVIFLSGAGLFFLAYFILFEMFWNGQTPGKRQASIRVIRDNGTPLTLTESLLRNIVRLVDLLPFYYGVGLISMLLSREGKRLGDYVAGTVVIKERGSEESVPLVPAQLAQDGLLATLVPLLTGLSARETAAVEQFIERRDALDPAIRSTLARQITAAVQSALPSLPANIPDDPEAFLELVYAALLKRREKL
ncbi:MAG: RDD family protein [Armatimonadetes bacterium]|nr:RDD family protein [Armatimonadota bacterium]